MRAGEQLVRFSNFLGQVVGSQMMGVCLLIGKRAIRDTPFDMLLVAMLE
jgi:hypothetical protein